MINLLIPLTKRKITLKEIFDVVQNSNYKEEICVRILCEKNNPILQEKPKTKILYTIDTYPLKTSEESMIFATTKALDVNELVIIRSGWKLFSTALFDELIERGKKKKDIVMFRRKKNNNKIKKYLKNFFQKTCNIFFNFNFFDGDLGCMYFSARAHNILQETNVTVMTKINRWACMEIEYIDKDFCKSKICEKTPVIIPLKLGMYLLLLISLIIGTIFLGKSGNLTLLLVILFVCLVTSFVCMSVYMILKWICFKKLGDIYSKKTDIVERR